MSGCGGSQPSDARCPDEYLETVCCSRHPYTYTHCQIKPMIRDKTSTKRSRPVNSFVRLSPCRLADVDSLELTESRTDLSPHPRTGTASTQNPRHDRSTALSNRVAAIMCMQHMQHPTAIMLMAAPENWDTSSPPATLGVARRFSSVGSGYYTGKLGR